MADDAKTTDKFTMKINGPGMAFEREIDAAVISKLIQLAFGGAQAAAEIPTPPPAWTPEADPRVDLDDDGYPDADSQSNKAEKKAAKKAPKKKPSYSATKGINFKPDGQTSWKDFATEKAPATKMEQALVAVYYMRETLHRTVATGDVIAAIDAAGWRNAADPANTLQQAGSKGWLDTGNMGDIKTVWAGEDYVKHDLPKPSTSKK